MDRTSMAGYPGYVLLAASAIASIVACRSLPKGVETNPAEKTYAAPHGSFDGEIDDYAAAMLKQGRQIFRYDTFGSESFWGDKLKLHAAIAGERFYGGSGIDGAADDARVDTVAAGPGLTPRQALKLGLKVDLASVPKAALEVLKSRATSLDDVETTMELLRANAVVGVTAFWDKDNKRMTAIGVQCALCHSTVDDSFMKGIGRRLDGWPNRDLDVGAIVALAPNVKPIADLLGVDEAKAREVLRSWGPGKYDAELNQDGKAFRPDGKSAATVLPAAFGLAGVNLHTYTGWGTVTYWNAYVANTQMYGQGTFFDPRLGTDQFPVAMKAGFANKRDKVDLVTSKLGPLHYYQLSIPAPKPPKGSFDEKAAYRGEAIFTGRARCARCHVPPLFVEPGWPMHAGSEIGIDDFQANRSPDKKYRTTPLRGLFTRMKGGFYHDGRFPTLEAVVEHYDRFFKLGLEDAEKRDLIEYLKSL